MKKDIFCIKMSSDSIDSNFAHVNTSDVQWQVSDKFKPDKEEQWLYPASKDGWVLAHNMIRNEVDEFIEGLKSISKKFPDSSPAWVIESIQKIWSHHEEVVHNHHSNEDDIMNPFMRTRVKLPEKLESDHSIVIQRINDVSNIVDQLNEGTSVDGLLTAVILYKTTLFPHLLEEEQTALPLLRSYFTPDEVKPIIMRILKGIGKSENGSFVKVMGEEYFRSTFMKQENIPFFVWHLKFKSDYKFFQKNVQCHFDALKEGSPPPMVAKPTMIC